MEKTELESRWEEEVEEEGLVGVFQEKDTTIRIKIKDVEAPLLILSGAKDYMGLFVDADSDFVCLAYPLLYGEMPVTDAKGEMVGLQPVFRKIYGSLDLIEELDFRDYNIVHFLSSEKEKDKRLAKVYEAHIEQIMAFDSGIVAPTSKDLNLLRK